MEKVLLLGNGVNRLSQNYSWGDLLREFIQKVDGVRERDNLEAKPFTLLFEEILLRSQPENKESKEWIKECKKIISELVQKLEYNDFHKQFVTLGVNDILTTNYDYNLEKALSDGKSEGEREGEETYHSLYRKRKCGEKSIWHIHGEADKPHSLMLGYQHYASSLSRMSDYLKQGNKWGDEENARNAQPTTTTPDNNKPAWVDVFLRGDVHIVGFSFDYTELDLWWLTIIKARLKLVHKDESVGKTVFHCINSEKEQGKISLLRSYGVDVQTYDLKGNNYSDVYKRIIDNLSK